MMNFRTQVELPKKETEIGHSDRIMLFGSCFAENIGNLLLKNKFRCDVNPFGVLYNPLSIAQALHQVWEGKKYGSADLFQAGGQWHSFMHHSTFSHTSSAVCIDQINARLHKAAVELADTDWLMITWGTAWVYALKEDGTIVGNCHKQPDRLFVRRLLSVDEIVAAYLSLLTEIRKVCAQLKVLFTVSPIRHLKDGMHGNQVSKSTLLLAVDALQQSVRDCFYFPSYELMMDELRDYRFYADDMLHPSALAVNYLWQCFSECYFSQKTVDIIKDWGAIQKALEHKPFDETSDAYRCFLTQIVLKIDQLKEKFPYFDLQKELELCQTRLNR